MYDTALDGITLIATIIGFLVLAWVAVCVICLMIFTVVMFWDHMTLARRHKYARHQKASEAEDLGFYIPDDYWAGPAPTPARTKLGYSGTPDFPKVESETEQAYLENHKFFEETAVFEPIDPEMTIVNGEMPTFEALESTDYPFNQGDAKNEAARDKPA